MYKKFFVKVLTRYFFGGRIIHIKATRMPQTASLLPADF